MNKIRKGDEVIVLTGRDKGKRGTVSLRVDADHLVVDGVNVVKKHVRPNPLKGTTRWHRRQDHADPPIQCGDLQPRDRQGRPRGIKLLDDGKKVRVFKSSGEEIKA